MHIWRCQVFLEDLRNGLGLDGKVQSSLELPPCGKVDTRRECGFDRTLVLLVLPSNEAWLRPLEIVATVSQHTAIIYRRTDLEVVECRCQATGLLQMGRPTQLKPLGMMVQEKCEEHRDKSLQAWIQGLFTLVESDGRRNRRSRCSDK